MSGASRDELQRFAHLVADALDNISAQLKLLADQVSELRLDLERIRRDVVAEVK